MTFIESLEELYGPELAQALIGPRELPLVPEIRLLLLHDDYPQDRLGAAAYHQLMASPPYWAFCWGGGQAMARFLLDNPHYVSGKSVIDFGAGSGVAGIAAALIGAKTVVGVDIDPIALQASQANAQLNGVAMEVTEKLSNSPNDFVLAADICYEEEGMEWVLSHLRNEGQLLVADSRIEQLSQKLPGVRQVFEMHIKTFPELDEASCFEIVKLYATDEF
ncbi:MAG: 50S ribosomal protein L11 methyltransferase [Pseudomonadales bacterium]|nr:50S ribosomal protein L11 methyltransferase [Pseudomonadales bacterium]